MKKISWIFLLLLAFKAEAQKSVVFKMKYLPQHNYDVVMSLAMTGNIALSGDDSTINKLKAQGMTFPIVAYVGLNISGNTKTGAIGADKSFPLVINYQLGQVSIKINGKEIPIPVPDKVKSGMTVYGHIGADGQINADSLAGSKLKDTAIKKISQTISSIQNKIKFPERALRVGDTFTQDAPLNIPMGAGKGPVTDIKVVYKLTGISEGNAYFDVVQHINVSFEAKKLMISLAGLGSGKLVYSIKNNFPLSYKTILNLTLDGKFNTLVVKGMASLNSEFKYTIN